MVQAVEPRGGIKSIFPLKVCVNKEIGFRQRIHIFIIFLNIKKKLNHLRSRTDGLDYCQCIFLKNSFKISFSATKEPI